MPRPPAPESRQKLLNATIAVVLDKGINHLTLEAVAQEATMSKGGLLHYFASKEALLNDLMSYLFQRFEARLADELDKEPADEIGRWARAYLRTVFTQDPLEQRLSATIAVVVTSSPSLLARFRKTFEDVQAQLLQDGISTEKAVLIRIATDGLWFSDVFSFAPLNAHMRSTLLNELTQLTLG